jgi:hypothetical protein
MISQKHLKFCSIICHMKIFNTDRNIASRQYVCSHQWQAATVSLCRSETNAGEEECRLDLCNMDFL